MSTLNVEGMSIASGVVETIVSIAASEVEGVASTGSYTVSGIRSLINNKPSTAGVEAHVDDDEKLHISLHVEVYYGYVLPDLAQKLRQSIADALKMQMGVDVGCIDIYIDGIQFTSKDHI